MTTSQIYDLLNSVNDQGMGKIPIEVVDTASFVALGDAVLTSANNVEPFVNTLIQVIGKDVVEGRKYTSQFSPFVKGSIEWGTIIRKSSIDMPEVVEEASVDLVDGSSIDHYTINKPHVDQYLFVNRTPYMITITVQDHWLYEAFRSESDMGAFVAMIYTKVQNKLELCIENLARAAMTNYAGLANGTSQEVNLVTLYNTENPQTPPVPTGLQALFNADFLRWSIGIIKEIMTNIRSMSVLYNSLGKERFTPYNNLNLVVLSRFQRQLETTALYSAFNENYIKQVSNYIVPYWQGSGDVEVVDAESRSKIHVEVDKGGTPTEVEIDNVVAMLFDDNALGCYRKPRRTASTPLNAKGLYINTFWHENQMWFNALDENYLLFTLN